MSLLNTEQIKKLLRQIIEEIREKPVGFASFHAFSDAADQKKRALVDADRHVQTDVLSMPEVEQSDASKLLATVTQAEKDRTITSMPEVEQSNPALLQATVTQADTARSITNFPTEYPLPSTQVSDLKRLEEISIFRFGAIKFKVDFVELGITRLYTIDYVMLSNWLAKNVGKTWKDYVKPDLLRLYNLLAGTKAIVDLMKKEAGE